MFLPRIWPYLAKLHFSSLVVLQCKSRNQTTVHDILSMSKRPHASVMPTLGCCRLRACDFASPRSSNHLNATLPTLSRPLSRYLHTPTYQIPSHFKMFFQDALVRTKLNYKLLHMPETHLFHPPVPQAYHSRISNVITLYQTIT